MAGKAGGGPEPEQDFVPGSALPEAAVGPRGGGAADAREGPPALTLPDAEALRGGRRVGPRRPDQLPQRPHSSPRAHPPEVPPAPAAAAPHWARRRGLAAGWPPGGVSPGGPLRAPSGGTRWRPAETRGGRGRRGGECRGGRRDFRHGTRKGPRRRWWEL